MTTPSRACLGQAAILRAAFEGRDLGPVFEALIHRVTEDSTDAQSLYDIHLILRASGQPGNADEILTQALAMRRDFQVIHGKGTGLKILCLVATGDFMANTPVDFLLEGSDIVVTYLYVDAGLEALDFAPDHDVMMVAIGQSEAAIDILQALAQRLPHWPKPVINADVIMISALSRDGVSTLLKDSPGLVSPITTAVFRTDLESKGMACVPDLNYPIIIRPYDSQAGQGLERLHDDDGLSPYLETHLADRYYVAPYYDYADENGLFGKQRIVLIKGTPYPSHFALSSDWIVHYLSAGMAEDATKRAIEAQWMTDFDRNFAIRHKDAFAALYDRIGLDYFGMDCAELPDGWLLIFELDVAMIVHDLDDAALYPYKKPAMHKLFAAFTDMMAKAAL